MQGLPSLSEPANDIGTEDEPKEKAERGLEHVAGAASVGENGYPEKTHENVDQLAERSQASAKKKAAEHHHEGLEGQGDVGRRQTDEGADPAQGGEKRYQAHFPGAQTQTWSLFLFHLNPFSVAWETLGKKPPGVNRLP